MRTLANDKSSLKSILFKLAVELARQITHNLEDCPWDLNPKDREQVQRCIKYLDCCDLKHRPDVIS